MIDTAASAVPGPVPAALPSWLADLRREEGFFCISSPRRYAHAESGYDEHYKSDPANMIVGRGVINLLRERGASMDGPAIEVGCGTGQVSLGLAAARAYPLTVITDPSPEFLKIAQGKIRAHGIPEDRVAYALLVGEELDRLPPAEFSLVVLRSTLHHVLDVGAFIAAAARALRPGGVLTFQEPCMEGYILMGAMAQFLPALAGGAGRPLDESQERKVDEFVRSMEYYSRRDVDKTLAEDKHLFRVDEIMKMGEASGLSVEFLPNAAYEVFSIPPDQRRGPDAFTPFFRGYARFCMGWDDHLMARFDEHLAPYCQYVENTAAGGSGPYMHGVFVAVKR
jgi:ubiquinone/menaquinone biosynthesis C-methylase UbiE